MTIREAFIPCAGLGSRMGAFGKKLPKPLWPLFEKSLVEVQQVLLQDLGIKSFYANIHHQFAKIESFNREHELGLQLIFESELLGNGGNFHNLKRTYPSVERVFVANPDVFLFMSKRDWKNFFAKSQKSCNLILMPVQNSYNEVQVDTKGCFSNVVPPPSNSDNKRTYLTYTGFSVIDLASLEEISGVSSFFDSVVNPKLRESLTFVPQDDFEYWDFGTLELFKTNIGKLLSQRSGLLWEFLTNNSLLDENNLRASSYVSNSGLFKLKGEALSLREHESDDFTLL